MASWYFLFVILRQGYTDFIVLVSIETTSTVTKFSLLPAVLLHVGSKFCDFNLASSGWTLLSTRLSMHLNAYCRSKDHFLSYIYIFTLNKLPCILWIKYFCIWDEFLADDMLDFCRIFVICLWARIMNYVPMLTLKSNWY